MEKFQQLDQVATCEFNRKYIVIEIAANLECPSWELNLGQSAGAKWLG